MNVFSSLQNFRQSALGLLVLAITAPGFGQSAIPTVTSQTVSQSVVVGQTVTVQVILGLGAVEALDISDISLSKDGVVFAHNDPGTNTIVTNIPSQGTYTISYTISNFQPSNAGSYQFVIRDKQDHVFIVDGGGDEVRILTKDGKSATPALTPPPVGTSIENPGIHALTDPIFNDPRGIAIDSAGNIFVADRTNQVIRKINLDGSVVTFAGAVGKIGTADGTGGNARFTNPISLAIDASDNLYVSDSGSSLIREITPAGVVTTITGKAGGGSVDGPVSTAKFFSPFGLAVDASGTIFVADALNNQIRKITAAGVVSTVAGVAGKAGSTDGTGTAALFNYPCGVALDSTGNLYVSDGLNNTLRKITPAGVVTTIAGSPGNSGSSDGTGSAARFYYPWGVVVDSSTGNIFVADAGNGTIRMVTPAGVVTTIAGSAGNTGNTDGNGSAARFTYPYEIKIAPYTFASKAAVLSVPSPTSPPTITTQPATQSISLGGAATFTVVASGATAYQWQKNGVSIAGATAATLTLTGLAATDAATYTVIVSNSFGSVTSAGAVLTIAPPSTARIVNLSVRSNAGTGSSTLIAGLVIGGSGSKQALLRGVGPGLTKLGVSGVLVDPQLSLHTTVNTQDTVVVSNAGWGGTTTLTGAFNQVGAFALDATSKDAAVLTPLASGAYTAQVVSTSGGTGVTLLEVYDADSGTPTARFINLSARTMAGTGTQTLIAGFVISGTGSKTILIRGVGPTLTSLGVTGVLANPQLSLHTTVNNQDTIVGSNTVWGGSTTLSSAFTQVGAFALPTTSADSALLVTLQPGAYTAQVTGANSTTGIALLEIYEMP